MKLDLVSEIWIGWAVIATVAAFIYLPRVRIYIVHFLSIMAGVFCSVLGTYYLLGFLATVANLPHGPTVADAGMIFLACSTFAAGAVISFYLMHWAGRKIRLDAVNKRAEEYEAIANEERQRRDAAREQRMTKRENARGELKL